MMQTLWLALLSIVMSVMAQFLLRTGVGEPAKAKATDISETLVSWFSSGYVIAGLAFYVIGALIWLRVLSQMEVSKAYPLVGFGFVLTAAIGFLMGESVSVQRGIGIAAICAGVWIVARS